MAWKFSRRQKEGLQPLIRWLIYSWMRFAYATSKIEYTGLENLPQEGGFILAAWHESWPQNPLNFSLFRNRRLFPAARPVCVLISSSREGRTGSWVAGRMGGFPVAASLTDKGRTSAVKLARKLLQGKVVNIFMDGPTGPRRQPKPGCVALAAATGLPVVPTAVAVKRKITFSSWDRTQLILPLSHALVGYGKPFSGSELKVCPRDQLPEKAREVGEATSALTDTLERKLQSRSSGGPAP